MKRAEENGKRKVKVILKTGVWFIKEIVVNRE